MTTSVKHTINFQDLGQIDYKEAWDYQEELLAQVINEKNKVKSLKKEKPFPENQVLLFCEHPHVYTIGKSGEKNNLLINSEFLKNIGAAYYKINRGGDITYHGPGQIVGYPIIDLEAIQIGVKQYVWMLEESIIRYLADKGIEGARLKGATGVWLEPDSPQKSRKICAIGVRVSNFVTMHGFAFNVNTDLRYFQYINPCGYTDKRVTSLEQELGKKLEFGKVKQSLLSKIAEVFDVEVRLENNQRIWKRTGS
jgi:lipoyl(octanoyl) transferase